METYEKAEVDYMAGMKYKDIAAKYGTTINTVKSWKKRYGWDRKKGAHKTKKVCTQKSDEKSTRQQCFDDGTTETMQNDELTPEQQMFCVYYSRTFNATKSYQKAYGCSYESAMCNGSRLLGKEKVRKEIERLKELKRQQIIVSTDDVVELQMRIAFADLGDYLTFGREKVPIIGAFGPLKDEKTQRVLTQEVNYMKLKESDTVDMQIVQEVRQIKGDVSIKLEDRQKAIDWLSKFFLMHPENKYKAEYEKKRAEIKDDSAERILENMQTIAEILNQPTQNRNIEDFEENKDEQTGTV